MTDQTPAAGNFQMNRPTIISLLYLGSFVLGITCLIGVVLAYVWRGEPGEAEWAENHYRYHIRTFWIGLVWSIVATILSIVSLFLLAWVVFPLVGVWFAVRAIKALLAAQRAEPIANVTTWMF